MRDTWECNDDRDALYSDRAFTVFGLDEIKDINRGFRCILYVIASPGRRRDDALIIDRVITTDVQRTARGFKLMLEGSGDVYDRHGRPDPDRTRFLRDRLSLYRRDHDNLVIQFAVCYRDRLPRREEPAPPITPDMLARVRHRLLDEGFGGFRWHTAMTAADLPQPPHAPALLSVVGVDAKGRIYDVVKPDVSDFHRQHAKDLRALAAVIVEAPAFHFTADFCLERGLTPVIIWRPLTRAVA